MSSTPKRSAGPTFAAVEVVCGKQCCEEVWALNGKRILTQDAPMLPLKNCSMQDRCACKFRKYADRRQEGTDRRALGGLRHSIRSSWYSGSERRDRSGRRESDVE